jgi:hypothetical protein
MNVLLVDSSGEKDIQDIYHSKHFDGCHLVNLIDKGVYRHLNI